MKFKKINTTDLNLSKVQDNVESGFQDLFRSNPILDGVFVNCALTTSDTLVNHTLARRLNGFLVVDRDANATVYKSTTINNRPYDQIILKASTSVNAKIYFF